MKITGQQTEQRHQYVQHTMYRHKIQNNTTIMNIEGCHW